MTTERATCVVVGGGPAGMVLGLLLARAGVEVKVLEKHGDFLRDFRGDTVHPSTLELLDELGLAERFAALPHSRVDQVEFPGRGRPAPWSWPTSAGCAVRHPYVAMVPQWDLLDLLADAGAAGAGVHAADAAPRSPAWSGRPAGSRACGTARRTAPTGELRADLTVACDGRWSVARRPAGLRPREYPRADRRLVVPAAARRRRHPNALTPRAGAGPVRGGDPADRLPPDRLPRPQGHRRRAARGGDRGVPARRRRPVPELADRVDALRSMDDVKHLDVRLNRLRRWHADGLLCIGDAAHAMSPVGGVGINLAVQDAVAAATLLAGPLRRGAVTRARARRGAPPAAAADGPGPGAAADDAPRLVATDHRRPADGSAGAGARAARPRPACVVPDGLRDRGRDPARARPGLRGPTQPRSAAAAGGSRRGASSGSCTGPPAEAGCGAG